MDRKPPIPIVQFTATPFREDGRRVDGEFIYTYPLTKAQEEGYFKPIRFEAVFGLDRPDADLAIIEKLGEVLAADLDAGLHLAMARCSTIERAKHLHRLYTTTYPEHRPVIVHSQQPLRERRENLTALRRFESRIIVCVDNLLSHGGQYHHCCHSNLTRALAERTGLSLREAEPHVHDVLNLFMCTGFARDTGQYFMKASPVRPGDYLEFFAEIDLLGNMSVCPGGDCSSEHSSDTAACHPLVVEIYRPQGYPEGWHAPQVNGYDRSHGL